MHVNRIQSNTNCYSQKSFKAKMDPSLVNMYKGKLNQKMAMVKTDGEVRYLLDVSKKFAQFLKDIKTENNTSTIVIKHPVESQERGFYQIGAGGLQKMLDAIYLIDDIDLHNLISLMQNVSADKIKKNERQFEEFAKEKDDIFKLFEPEN